MNMVVNGVTNGNFEDFETLLESELKDKDNYFKLRDMNINFCQGCWECWVKSPGVCKLKDDYELILKKVPSTKTITIITPVIVGYESYLIKTFSDRMIPIVQPYIEISKGEQHHVQRYKKNPNYRVIVLEDEHTTPEDIDTIKELYERKLLNFKADLIDVISLKKGEDYTHVINSI